MQDADQTKVDAQQQTKDNTHNTHVSSEKVKFNDYIYGKNQNWGKIG
jgi:hypothetical protein